MPQAAHPPRFANALCPAPCWSHCRKGGDAACKGVTTRLVKQLFLFRNLSRLPLWVPGAFYLFNNKKTQSSRERFSLGVWVGSWGREWRISRSVMVMLSLRMGCRLIVESKLQITNKGHLLVNSDSGCGPKMMTNPILSSTSNYYKDTSFYCTLNYMPGTVLSA